MQKQRLGAVALLDALGVRVPPDLQYLVETTHQCKTFSMLHVRALQTPPCASHGSAVNVIGPISKSKGQQDGEVALE